jgi:uncharacterized protein HemX
MWSTYLMYAAIVLGIIFVILMILGIAGKGEALRKWLGPIGGIILAIVAVLGIKSASGGGGQAALQQRIKELEKERDDLKARADDLKKQADALDAQYKKDKADYEASLAPLQTKLAESESSRQQLEASLASMVGKDPLTWFNGLPEAERQRILDKHSGGPHL